MEKRLIIAFALSVLVIVSFQMIAPRPKMRTEPQATQLDKPVVTPSISNKVDSEQIPEIVEDEKDIVIENNRLKITLSNVGGAIKKIELKEYKDRYGDYSVVSNNVNYQYYIGALSSISGDARLAKSVFDVETTSNSVIFSADIDGLTIIKKYSISDDSYIVDISVDANNRSANEVPLSYSIIAGSGIIEPDMQSRQMIEIQSKIDGKVAGFKRPGKSTVIRNGAVEWSALKSRYFSMIMKPLSVTDQESYSETSEGNLVSKIKVPETTIKPMFHVEHTFTLYAGPSSQPILAKYGLEETMTYGFFGDISKLLLWFMRLFYNMTKNWGIAIIVLSVFLNLILYPLTLKSMTSMKKMQMLHPQMEKLKSQFKDNPQKLNKEMMELYKKNKINPLGGCLPMLLQMPVFIALYQALSKSIDLRAADFLWIRDLSMPEAIKIPVTLPLIGNSLNILPLVMVAGMVIQQKMSSRMTGGAVTDEQKQQQKMMLIIMPIMFGFIFYNMPSGLVLYWVINTTLTIVEQSFMFRSAK